MTDFGSRFWNFPYISLKSAQNGAISTTSMKAHAGRASYVNPEHLKQPDPGAHAVGIWMRAAAEAFKIAS